MPILSLDQFGRLYETSPDRGDGRGYKGHPEKVSRGDLTLGNAYLNAEKDYQRDIIEKKRIQKILDQQEAARRHKLMLEKVAKRINDSTEERMRDNELYQQSLLRRAIQMGCPDTMTTPMNGNELTANGQSGWAGMSRDQKVIHHHMSGLGEVPTVAHGVDPVEAYQAQIRAQANKIIDIEARKKAKLVEAEAKQSRLEKAVTKGTIVKRMPLTSAFVSKAQFHPMQMMAVKRREPVGKAFAPGQLKKKV